MDDQERFDYIVRAEHACLVAQNVGRKALTFALAGSLGIIGETGYLMMASIPANDIATEAYVTMSIASVTALRVRGMARQYKDWKTRRCIAKTGQDPLEFLPESPIFLD
jgi:hypothetical protein